MSDTLVNGYRLFTLGWGRDPQESVTFNEFTGSFGDGFYSQSLFGSKTGLKRWAVQFPAMRDYSSAQNITFKGVSYTPAQYLWNLYLWQKQTGEPFVVQSPRNNQYYLARFASNTLTETRILTSLATSGVEIVQCRKPGVSVFDISAVAGVYAWLKSSALTGYSDNDAMSGTWEDSSSANHDFTISGGMTYQTNEQNGLPVARFNGSSGYLASTHDATIYAAFFVLSVETANWTNYGGVLTGDTGSSATNAAMVGNAADTRLFNFGFGSGYEYYLNGVKKTEAIQITPHQTFGVMAGVWPGGNALTNIQIGRDRAATDRYAQIDLLEAVLINQPLTEEILWLIQEDLEIRNGI